MPLPPVEPSFPNRRRTFGVTVAVTQTPQNLYALLVGVDPKIDSSYQAVFLQNDPDNTASSGTTGEILVGDEQVAFSPLRAMFKLTVSGSQPVNLPLFDGVDLTALNVVTDSATPVSLNVGGSK